MSPHFPSTKCKSPSTLIQARCGIWETSRPSIRKGALSLPSHTGTTAQNFLADKESGVSPHFPNIRRRSNQEDMTQGPGKSQVRARREGGRPSPQATSHVPFQTVLQEFLAHEKVSSGGIGKPPPKDLTRRSQEDRTQGPGTSRAGGVVSDGVSGGQSVLGDVTTGDDDNKQGQAVTVVCLSSSGEESVVGSRGGVDPESGQAVTVVCPGISGGMSVDAPGGPSVLGDVSEGTGGVVTTAGQAVTVVCSGTSGEVGDDAPGGQSMLGDVPTGEEGCFSRGRGHGPVSPIWAGARSCEQLEGRGRGPVSPTWAGAAAPAPEPQGDARGGQAVPQVTTFMSYNSTGIDQNKCKWIKYVANNEGVNYTTLQEHFKTVKSTAQWFCGQFKEYSTYVTQAYRLPGTANGRGRGGLVQLCLRDTAVPRTRVATKSPRLQAQVLSFPTCKVLWVNGYMPCDPQLQTFDDSELLATLAEVENLIVANAGCEVIWAADLNYEASRDNHFTRTVSAALKKMGLVSVWEDHPVDFTHVHTDGVSTSTIDHFLVSRKLRREVVACKAVHSGDNLSRHSPIILSLRLGDVCSHQAPTQPPPRRSPAWAKATGEELHNYTAALHNKLLELKTPVSLEQCKDPSCRDGNHDQERDDLVLDVLCSIVESSYSCLPLTGKAGGTGTGSGSGPGHRDRDRDILPGWTTEVEPFCKASKLAYKRWTDAGKPRNGPLLADKLRSHALFRHAVKRVKRCDKLSKAKGLFNAAMSGDLDLFKEMKRVKSGGGQMEEMADTVDGSTGEEEIAGTFAKIFNTLYNSSESNAEMEEIQRKLQELVRVEDSVGEVEKVTEALVKKAVGTLKSQKMDVSQGFSSDALLNGPDILFKKLASIFRSWLRHGKVTRQVLACAIIPLVKGSKDPARTDSYRAIASSSLLLKLFERCVIMIWGDHLSTDSLQFGFKKKCSTGQATWLAQEVMQHYLRQGTKPVAVVLDCTKAFDLAKFNILFTRLLDSGMPAVVVRVLAQSYRAQEAWVRWGRLSCSSTFRIANGTRQGSVASPAFWCIYLDPLFLELRRSGIGCHLGGIYVGVVGYADDLLLLAPSRDAAQRMLQICEKFTNNNNILFSTDPDPTKSKSKCIHVVGPREQKVKPAPLILGGRELPWVPRAEHLGHTLCEDGTSSQDCREKRAQFIDSSVKIRESFDFAHPADQITCVEKYCSAAYGSNLWDFTTNEAAMYTNAWRTGHKVAWDVPRGCRSYLVDTVLAPHVDNMRASLLHRQVGFFHGLLRGPSREAAVAALLASRDKRTTIGANLALIADMTNMDPWTAGKRELRAALEESMRPKIPDGEEWRVPALHKLLSARILAKYMCDKGEEVRLQELIDSICVN